MASTVRPRNGGNPVSISKSTDARLYWSLLLSTSASPTVCSGLDVDRRAEPDTGKLERGSSAFTYDTSDTEVHDLCVIAVEEDVLGLDIPMYHAVLVGV